MLGGKLIRCQKVLKWYTFILSFTWFSLTTVGDEFLTEIILYKFNL